MIKIDAIVREDKMEDVKDAYHYDAEGIGLFRSEFLYLEANTSPSLIRKTVRAE